MRKRRVLSYTRARDEGYVGDWHFYKCPDCECVDFEYTQGTVVLDENHRVVEAEIRCKNCGRVLGYISYGNIEPYFTREFNSFCRKRLHNSGLKQYPKKPFEDPDENSYELPF